MILDFNVSGNVPGNISGNVSGEKSSQPFAYAQRQGVFNYLFLSSIGCAAFFWLLFISSNLHAAERPDSFADLAERLSPAVVNISTSTVVQGDNEFNLPQFPEGSPFEEFFKEFNQKQGARKAQSLGSGFITDASGIIITNNHVIENADEITVILFDETEFEAELIGRDPKTDIAVLRIDPGDTELSAVSFGDSDSLRVGDWVMAIGNPFGLGGTVTAGIVSARGRDIGSGPYDDFIQTDASINRGNSGGPLFDLNGEVIGINTAIFSQSGGSVGIGFAIASNLADDTVSQLVEYGRTRRGWLGVFIQEVTEDIADSLGLQDVNGALISAVTPGGPAEKTGLEPGDTIITFDNQKIKSVKDLPRIVAETPVDKKVAVDIIRSGKKMVIDVVLGELEQAEQSGVLNGDMATDQPVAIVSLGIALANISTEFIEKYDLDSEEIGVVITEVIEGSPAANMNLKEGNIIRRIGQRKVDTVETVMTEIERLREADRSGVLMLIESQGRNRFVQLPFADK
jgi:serine protease Do